MGLLGNRNVVSITLLGALSALLCAGCPCEPGYIQVFRDDFESKCGDLPCNWVVEAGTAHRVVTFHSAEHGFRLADSARVRRPIPDVVLFPGEARVTTLVRCDSGAGLRFTLIFDPGGPPIERTGDLPPGTGLGSSVMREHGVDLSTHDGTDLTPLQEVVIELTGTGECVLDDLSIQSGSYNACEG
jgi:hypothetical protein